MRVPHLPILQKIATYLSQGGATKPSTLNSQNPHSIPNDVVSVGKAQLQRKAVTQANKPKETKKKDEKPRSSQTKSLQDDHELDIEV